MNDDLICLSDLHGCWFTLVRLLNRAPKGLKVVFGGDLIDRGPHSRKVVEFAMQNSIPTVRANHDDLCIAFYRPGRAKCGCHYDDGVWLDNGGKECLRNWPEIDSAGLRIAEYHRDKRLGGRVPDDVLDWMAALPPYLYPSEKLDKNGRRLFCSHTGYGLNADSGHWMSALWGRYPESGPFRRDLAGNEIDDGLYRVFGHTRSERAIVTDKWARIDTGAAYGGGLTGFMWPSKQLLYQPFDETPVDATFSIDSGVLV